MFISIHLISFWKICKSTIKKGMSEHGRRAGWLASFMKRYELFNIYWKLNSKPDLNYDVAFFVWMNTVWSKLMLETLSPRSQLEDLDRNFCLINASSRQSKWRVSPKQHQQCWPLSANKSKRNIQTFYVSNIFDIAREENRDCGRHRSFNVFRKVCVLFSTCRWIDEHSL